MADDWRMKNSKTDAPKSVRAYMAKIGRTGGEAGSKADKREAALAMWRKHPEKRKANLAVTLAAGSEQ